VRGKKKRKGNRLEHRAPHPHSSHLQPVPVRLGGRKKKRGEKKEKAVAQYYNTPLFLDDVDVDSIRRRGGEEERKTKKEGGGKDWPAVPCFTTFSTRAPTGCTKRTRKKKKGAVYSREKEGGDERGPGGGGKRGRSSRRRLSHPMLCRPGVMREEERGKKRAW